ncbi:MAG: UDP-glucose dehydrogenase family protein [Eubacteriales bacterium]
MRKIAVIGTGYVGLVSGTCLADFGLSVICVDKDEEKINDLKSGNIPIYEPGLEDLVIRNKYYKRISFTIDIKEAVEECDVIFIAVGTPPLEDGSADMQYVIAVAEEIAQYINSYKVIVNKSTVPVGTAKKIKKIFCDILKKREVTYNFDIVSNPEFLREGAAIHDFTHPDRVVLGVESKRAENIMKEVYRVLYLNETPFIITNLETAEMIKYASNAFLAMKISYINEVANLCEKIGADIHHVASAMGKDGRISPKFLHPGPGYGGSCFPKDTRALAHIGKEYNSPISLVETTIKANERQKKLMAEKIIQMLNNVKDVRIAILGLTFKPNTDDMRESPSLSIVPELIKKGAILRVFDPQGEKEGKLRLKQHIDRITFCKDEYEALKGTDALVILTEWHQFRNMDLKRIKDLMNGNYFFDFRNIYERKLLEEQGFKYYAIGR